MNIERSSHYKKPEESEDVRLLWSTTFILFLSNVVEIHTKYGSPRSGGPDAINVVVVGASVCRSVCDLFREPNWERFQPSPFG